MKGSTKQTSLLRTVVLGMALSGAIGLTGCQVDVGGQTLPSPYYLWDDVQYFPPGPEMKLMREAQAMKAAAAESPQGECHH
ncbi:MAG: hypothetical protein ACOY3P_23230 [Planctomycetota bacterium]